jgi:hypothetical protein
MSRWFHDVGEDLSVKLDLLFFYGQRIVRGESQNTNKVLRFRVSLSEHEAEMSLTVG